MNFRELKDLTSFWLDDLQFGYFTDAQVSLWLNNAQNEVQKRLIKASQQYYTVCVQTTLVVNQFDYVLPLDFKKVMRLEVIVSGTSPNESVIPVIPITLNQKDLVITGNGTPQFYTIKRNRLVVRPAPDTALQMRLYYAYQVASMVLDTDLPDVPDAYHELIALYACQDGFIKDGRSNALLGVKIMAYEKDMDSDAQERNQDQSRSIVVTGDDTSSGYYF